MARKTDPAADPNLLQDLVATVRRLLERSASPEDVSLVGAFARNLVQSGWHVIGYDVDAQRNAAAKAAGVEIAHSAEAVAESAADIILSLPSARAVLDTVGVLAGANVKDRTVVEASTLSLADKLAVKATLEAAGHTALDCPMSGTGAQAAVKDLVVYASGDSAAICSSTFRNQPPSRR